MGKIATWSEIAISVYGRVKAEDTWVNGRLIVGVNYAPLNKLNNCPTKSEVLDYRPFADLGSLLYSWEGTSSYANNRLVELSMIKKYTPPIRTVTLQCQWVGPGATYLSLSGELTLSNGTKFPFSVSKYATIGYFTAMDFYVNNVPGYEITSVALTQVHFNIAPSGDVYGGYLQTYTIHDASNSVELNLGIYGGWNLQI